MKNQLKLSVLILTLLIFSVFSMAASFVKEASFYRVFDGKDYYTKSDGKKVDFNFVLNTMSTDGKIIAFYGNTYFDGVPHYALFIHNFESATEPMVVPLLERTGSFNRNAGMVSNADGSRIFFFAVDNDDINGFHELYMLNGLTGELTVIFHTSSIREFPQDIATDANGDYLYFNEGDQGDRGHLWRVAASAGATPSIYIDQSSLVHPSGGTVRFIDQMDVSDNGLTIAFFVEGRIPADGNATVRYDRELFVKTTSNIRHITNNDVNSKNHLVISGDGSTIVYSTPEWMVTTPDAVVESQIKIEDGYNNRGFRPGITTDGSTIFASSNPNGVSNPQAYLIKTDGSGREMVEPSQIDFLYLHLSGDGKRVFFKNRKYIYPNEWYNMTVGTFDRSLWTNKVPRITSVIYPSDMFTKLENNERFNITISVNNPQEDVDIIDLKETVLFPNGYEAKGSAGPIAISPWIEVIDDNLYATEGYRGTDWPSNDPVKVRFSVEDEDGNVGYADTIIERLKVNPAVIMYLLN